MRIISSGKALNVLFRKCHKLSDNDLNEMTGLHAVEEPRAAAEVTSDRNNDRSHEDFEEASIALINQKGNLFSSNEAVEPLKPLKMTS